MKMTPCRFLEWDSAFFGCRIARVEGNYLSEETAGGVLEWCKENQIRCLYFLCAPDDDESVYEAEVNKFHLVDLRIELLWQSSQPNGVEAAHYPVRPAHERDTEAMLKIARTAYTSTRFYYDKHFLRDQVSSLYAHWLTKSCNGLAQQVLVSVKDGEAVGYITCHLDSDDCGSIGLIGVSDTSRGAGVGRSLVTSAQEYFLSHGSPEVRVVTQGRNLPAQKLYQSCGFRTDKVQLWYHRWF